MYLLAFTSICNFVTDSKVHKVLLMHLMLEFDSEM